MIPSRNSIEAFVFRMIVLFVIDVLTSMVVYAQVDRRAADELLYEKVQRLTDSVNNLNPNKTPLYLGYEVVFTVPQFNLESNISKLDGLHATFLGSSLGVVAGNHRGKMKANFGLFYSDDATPYTIDLTRSTISSNIYLLRTGAEIKYHSLEPYAIVGMSYMATKFFGNYIDVAEKHSSKKGDEPLLGKTHAARAFVGGGVEFQLESDTRKFVHIFAEATFSRAIAVAASNKVFDGTNANNAVFITLGVSFGLIK